MKKPLVLGKYLLLERVNIGGMAEVFIAKTFGVGGFEQILAVKKILPTMAEDEEFIKMFIDEARVSVQLNHPNIVHIHDLDGRDDSYYIVMEYVSGRDLRSVLERFRRRKEIMPVPMAAYIASKMCEGLDHAHRKKDVKGMDLNIVHRDVSPQNILLSYEGEVKIIDFGIARTAIRSTKTEVGVIKGKFGYMSPEQAYGSPVDRRSDVFAAAVILYEMLTGEKLFSAESDYSTLEKVRRAEFRSPRQVNAEIPQELEEVLLRALAREVGSRYQWASELHDALEPFIFVEDGKFSAKQLSATLKEMFSDEYTRETNKLRHYGGLLAPDILLPEEGASLQELATFRRENGQTRTPSPQPRVPPRPASFAKEDATQVVSSAQWDAQGMSLAGPHGEGPSGAESGNASENLSPIQLLPGVPVYTGDTVVGKEAADIFSSSAQSALGLETARRISALSSTDEPVVPAHADEDTKRRLRHPDGFSRFRAWLYLGLVSAAVVSLWVVLLMWGGVPSSPPSGRLVAVSTPADIPLEIVVKSDSTQREQRFVLKEEAIVLPADTYQVRVNSLDKKFRLPPQAAGPLVVVIPAGEDAFLPVSLEAAPQEEKQPGAGEGGKLVVAPPGPPPSTPDAGPKNVPDAGGKAVEPPPGGLEDTATVKVVSPGTLEKTDATLPPAKETFVLSLGELLNGTQVFVGGKLQGTAPALKELTLPMQGSHKIELRKVGFEKFAQTIQNTEHEQTMQLQVVMRPLPEKQPAKPPPVPPPGRTVGKLVISTEPNGAEIWVNGKKTSFRTPMSFSNPLLLPEGKHTLLFKAGGKQSKPVAVEVRAENASSPISLRGIRIE